MDEHDVDAETPHGEEDDTLQEADTAHEDDTVHGAEDDTVHEDAVLQGHPVFNCRCFNQS